MAFAGDGLALSPRAGELNTRSGGALLKAADAADFKGKTKSAIELLAPLSDSSPVSAFLQRNPLGGQHHLAFEVPDISVARAEFEGLGKRILGPTRIGAHGTPVFFVHPKDMAGVLTEIMETPRGAH